MAESVDALVSNTSRFTPVPVRPRLWVRKEGEEKTSPFFVQCVTYPPKPPFCKGGFIRVSDSRLLRTFDPLKDFSGRGQYHAVTKGEISHEDARSKIGHRRVQKRGKLKNFPRFYFLILVTYWFADILEQAHCSYYQFEKIVESGNKEIPKIFHLRDSCCF